MHSVRANWILRCCVDLQTALDTAVRYKQCWTRVTDAFAQVGFRDYGAAANIVVRLSGKLDTLYLTHVLLDVCRMPPPVREDGLIVEDDTTTEDTLEGLMLGRVSSAVQLQSLKVPVKLVPRFNSTLCPAPLLSPSSTASSATVLIEALVAVADMSADMLLYLKAMAFTCAPWSSNSSLVWIINELARPPTQYYLPAGFACAYACTVNADAAGLAVLLAHAKVDVSFLDSFLLGVACQRSLDCVRLLVETGAVDPEARDGWGRRVAQVSDMPDVVAYLDSLEFLQKDSGV
ncbi:hypothetical protein HDU83_002547 [Entophlyctis luteolus]|nr:hypothetical protein HDU83_002547 [Entophlyctis luteolus]